MLVDNSDLQVFKLNFVLLPECLKLLLNSFWQPCNALAVCNHPYYNAINQVISYWTSYRSEVSCIGPRPEAEVQYS